MNANVFPNAFVWTRINDDSGQAVHLILNRKELERQAGNTFWWGIGESKATKVKRLVARDAHPAVLFSEMPSRAHRRDSNPNGVLLWEEYETAKGKVKLPSHVVVVSRAHQQNGVLKLLYHALVCECPLGIPRTGGGSLDSRTFRNFGDGGRSIGSSQITAVVERTARNGNGRLYPIAARATLVAPYAVQLAAPRLLSPRERRLLDDVSLDGKTAEDWLAFAKQLRRTDGRSMETHERQGSPSFPAGSMVMGAPVAKL
jgi:hypothetical protein